MEYIKNAEKGNIFVLTKKGYEKTPCRVKPEREIGKPIREFEYKVPPSWIEKGYVEQIPEPYREESEQNETNKCN